MCSEVGIQIPLLAGMVRNVIGCIPPLSPPPPPQCATVPHPTPNVVCTKRPQLPTRSCARTDHMQRVDWRPCFVLSSLFRVTRTHSTLSERALFGIPGFWWVNADNGGDRGTTSHQRWAECPMVPSACTLKVLSHNASHSQGVHGPAMRRTALARSCVFLQGMPLATIAMDCTTCPSGISHTTFSASMTQAYLGNVCATPARPPKLSHWPYQPGWSYYEYPFSDVKCCSGLWKAVNNC